MTTKELINLNQFSGTENYHRVSILHGKMVITDGVKYLADEAGCYWLLDIVASVQHLPRMQREEFQVWELKKLDDPTLSKAQVVCTDGNERKLYKQDIPFTDFPFDAISHPVKLFLQNNVVMLPSEY
jgi:hypothetical protein